MEQLPTSGAERPAGEGWYYDDFSDERANVCKHSLDQRIAFTTAASVPPDVHVLLDCNYGVATRVSQ